MDDFSQKEDRFFTMSIYMLNEFKQKNSGSLSESIPLQKISNLPSIIQGSVGCVLFQGEGRSINICLGSEEKAKNLIEAYKDFLKCRRGDSLNIFKTATIINILKSSCIIYFVFFNYFILAANKNF